MWNEAVNFSMLSVNQVMTVILTCIPFSESINLRKAALGIIAAIIGIDPTNIVLKMKTRILCLGIPTTEGDTFHTFAPITPRRPKVLLGTSINVTRSMMKTLP